MKADPSRKILLEKQEIAIWAIDLTPFIDYLEWLLLIIRKTNIKKLGKKKAWPDFLFHWLKLFLQRFQRQTSNFCEIFLLNAGKDAVGFLSPLPPAVSPAPSPPVRPTYFRYQLSLSAASSCLQYAYLFAMWVSFLRDTYLKCFVFIKGFGNIHKPMNGEATFF